MKSLRDEIRLAAGDMDGFNFIRVSGFHLHSRFHPCLGKDFIKTCPTRSYFPVGHVAFLGRLPITNRWIYGGIVGIVG